MVIWPSPEYPGADRVQTHMAGYVVTCLQHYRNLKQGQSVRAARENKAFFRIYSPPSVEKIQTSPRAEQVTEFGFCRFNLLSST